MWAFTELTVMQEQRNHVDFPTHQCGGSFDPLLTDLAGDSVQCSPLDFLGTFDHLAVLSTFIRASSHRADWNAARRTLNAYPWDLVLIGEPHHDVHTFTTVLLDLQQNHVPKQRALRTTPGLGIAVELMLSKSTARVSGTRDTPARETKLCTALHAKP
ncbi:hypothetical protein E2C01_077735 [Portunus trituberculatus]|uniref:Uncharacterized protein n=1 Tax=Portunus trituberculatus TaxID=210409 RepID=A0A5B7IL23_PORTR|nr:hypothetical protein [Portunus trituberculatus]